MKKLNLINLNSEILLDEGLFFLKEGLKWSTRTYQNYKKYLLDNNKKLGNYGYVLKDTKNKIHGGLILIYQGESIFNANKINIINMSSLYVIPESRGFITIYMLKMILKEQSKNIITQVTANNKAHCILSKIGFKKTNTYNSKLTIWSILKNIISKEYCSISKVVSQDINSIKVKELLNYKKADTNKETLIIKGNILLIIWTKVYIDKFIGGLHMKIPGIRILWTSDKIIYKKYFYQICFFIMTRKLLFFITSHCTEIINPKESNKNLCHLYKSSVTYNPEFICIGSELSINL